MQWKWTEEKLKDAAIRVAYKVWQRIVDIINTRLAGKHNFRVVLEWCNFKEGVFSFFKTETGFVHFSVVVVLGVVGARGQVGTSIIFDSTLWMELDTPTEGLLMRLDVSDLRVETNGGETVLNYTFFVKRLVDEDENGIPTDSISEQHLSSDVFAALLKVIVTSQSPKLHMINTFFLWCADLVLMKFANLFHTLWEVTAAPTDVYAYFRSVKVPPRFSKVRVKSKLEDSNVDELHADFSAVKLTIEFLSAKGATLNTVDLVAVATLLLWIEDLENCKGMVRLEVSSRMEVGGKKYFPSASTILMKFNSPADLTPSALQRSISQPFATLIQTLINRAYKNLYPE